jgi:tRNA-Thr(GGU) m(6)t(6)A37 methyltransferase TsaA
MMRWSIPLLLVALTLLIMPGCATAQRPHGKNAVMRIDGKDVPLSELYPDDAKPITIRPIGIVVNDKRPGPVSFGIGSDISEIHLYPGMARFMKGLEDESALLILWHFHKAGPIQSVFVRGWEGKRVGPFASRTPNRPTPIGATIVDLVEVKGTTLVVRGLDAYNGTPVLDIKVAMKSLRRHPRPRDAAGAGS